MSAAPWLRELERSLAGDTGTENLAVGLIVLATMAGADVQIDPDDVRGAARRALFLLAAGGDPERGLDLDGRAVSALAEELRTVDRQLELERGLLELRLQVQGLPHTSEAVHGLIDAPDVAWRAYAAGLLADQLGSD
ncbi:MAG TPA: hypothetical protein VGJ49_08140 [Gaiellaceae bacterium]